MQFTTSTIIAFSAFITVGLSAALPASQLEATLQKRSGAVYFCVNANFVGPCASLSPSLDGTCYNFPPGYHDTISSIGPDGDIVCTFYSGPNCAENEPKIDGVVSPGWTDLMGQVRPPGSNGTPPSGNWGDALDSLRCWRR